MKRVYCNDCGLEFDEEFEVYRCPECYSHSVRELRLKSIEQLKAELDAGKYRLIINGKVIHEPKL